MDFNYLGLVNRILSMGQQTPISAIETDNTSWGYKAQWAVNDAIKDLSVVLKLNNRISNFTITTVAGQRLYSLPVSLSFPLISLKQSSTPSAITQISARDYDELIPSDTSSDNPTRYYLEEYGAVQNQPTVYGSDPNYIAFYPDTSEAINFFVSGYEYTGSYTFYHTESVAITTGAVSAANAYSKITTLTKPISNGNIRVTTSTGETETLAYFGALDISMEVPIIGLYPIPSKVDTIYGRGYEVVRSMTDANERPAGFPEITVNAIVANAFARFMQNDPKMDSGSRDSLWGAYNKELAKLISMKSDDGIQYAMKSSSWNIPRKVYFRPLTRDGV